MSWIEEEFTETDAAKNKLNAVRRQITNRWFDAFPEDEEGSEGEVRYVYANGMPAICVKMNGSWHFMPLQTIGLAGAYRTDDGGLTADMLQDYMPLEPAADSGWRQLLPIEDLTGVDQGDWQWSGGDYWGTQTYVGSGPKWECVGPGPDAFGTFVYLYRHNLNLARPPKNVQVYICDSPPDSGSNVDTFGDPVLNCLAMPYPTLEAAIADGIRLIAMSSDPEWIINETEDFAIGGTPGLYDGKVRSIAAGGMGFQKRGPFDNTFGAQMTMSVNTVIISPNEILFCPQWPVQLFNSMNAEFDAATQWVGFQNFEWLKFMIWR